jgi:hypothetical protein
VYLSTPCNGFATMIGDFLVLAGNLSTPCNGFRTMGALVMVYCFAVTGFHFVFYCCAPVFSAVGPLWSWFEKGVFKLYSTSSPARPARDLDVVSGWNT